MFNQGRSTLTKKRIAAIYTSHPAYSRRVRNRAEVLMHSGDSQAGQDAALAFTALGRRIGALPTTIVRMEFNEPAGSLPCQY